MKIKNPQKKSEKTESNYLSFKKEVYHICSQLYKIRKINRKRQYTIIELREIVKEDPIGKKVIKELKEKGVTCTWFEFHGQTLLHDVFLTILDTFSW